MESERLAMRNEKIKLNSILLCSLLTALCYLALGCRDPLLPLEHGNPWAIPPAGKGSFSLSITISDSARTILPTLDKSKFVLYELEFTPLSGDVVFAERTSQNLSQPVYLDPGTYSLVVKAYFDGYRLAAQGSTEDLFVISEGESTTKTVTLSAIKNGGPGSFIYTVKFLLNITSATMNITTQADMPIQNVDLKSEAITEGSMLKATGTLNNLETGYYNVVFTLVRNDERLVWQEFMHIYSNLGSAFEIEFTNDYFSLNKFTVTFEFNNGTPQVNQSVLHGSKVSRPLDPEPEIEGYAFGGWYTTAACTLGSEYDFTNTYITGDITLYAKWNEIRVTGVTLNITSTSIFVEDSLGDTETLTALVAPNNALNKTVTWESSNTNIATVNGGTVTAVATGTAIITVRTDDGSYTATCTVNVVSPIPLVEGEWTDGEITSTTPNREDWYSISVEAGKTYYLWWNDTDNYWGTLDIKIAASYKGGNQIFDVDNPGNNSQSFTANSNGMVYIKVSPFSSSSTAAGTYGIVYSTTNTRPNIDWTQYSITPLIEDTWADGITNTDTPNREDWYSISVTAGKTYNLWWNDSSWGDHTKTLNIKVSVWYENGNIAFSDKSSNVNAWDVSRAFTPTSNGTVYIRVSPYNNGSTGTYGIVYSTTGRPGWTPPLNCTPLIENLWVDGEITTATPNKEDLYSISVTAGTRYYFWWNDTDNSGGTLDIKVAALYSGAIQIFDVDLPNNQSFIANTTGTVYIRVYPFSSSSTAAGTYGIVYSTTNTRPDINKAVIFIEIDIEDIVDQASDIDIGNETIHRNSDNGAQTMTFTYTGSGSCTWSIKKVGSNETITESGDSFTVDATDPRYNTLGRHAVILVVRIDGVPYSKTIWVTIAP